MSQSRTPKLPTAVRTPSSRYALIMGSVKSRRRARARAPRQRCLVRGGASEIRQRSRKTCPSSSSDLTQKTLAPRRPASRGLRRAARIESNRQRTTGNEQVGREVDALRGSRRSERNGDKRSKRNRINHRQGKPTENCILNYFCRVCSYYR